MNHSNKLQLAVKMASKFNGALNISEAFRALAASMVLEKDLAVAVRQLNADMHERFDIWSNFDLFKMNHLVQTGDVEKYCLTLVRRGEEGVFTSAVLSVILSESDAGILTVHNLSLTSDKPPAVGRAEIFQGRRMGEEGFGVSVRRERGPEVLTPLLADTVDVMGFNGTYDDVSLRLIRCMQVALGR